MTQILRAKEYHNKNLTCWSSDKSVALRRENGRKTQKLAIRILQYLNSYIIARQNTGHFNRHKMSLSAVTNILYVSVPGRSKGVRKIITDIW